jgi:EAL domain-containing protein (putative c-di-GMP-specific phosphodiesterase class I)
MAAISASAIVLNAIETAAEDHMGPVTYLPGSVILQEGERGNCAFLIESGQVRVSKRIGDVERDIAVLGSGELIGEMAPIDSQARSATATALTQVEVVPISRANLEELLEKCDPLLNLMLRAMFNRLRDMQQRVAADAPNRIAPPGHEAAPLDERYRRALDTASDNLKMEQALSQALKRREFVLHYQPIVDISDRRIVGFEALIRWIRPDVGMVSPLDFVHTAERTGLIVPIGLWVLEQAGFILQRMRSTVRAATGKDRKMFMTVNVSARQIRDPEDVESMCNTINASGVDPCDLKLEITENVLVEHADSALEALQRFRSMGVQIAIDDFGTGYSSLSYLHQYPLNVLKIDRSFTSSMFASEQSRKLMRSIIGLARGMELDVVAEGIEVEEELALLKKMGCAYGQGYLFSKPVTLPDAERLLESD